MFKMQFNKISAVAVFALLVSYISVGEAQLQGSASSNPNGGADVTLSASKSVGDNLRGGLFAAGNTNGGPVTRGGFLEAGK